jgi:membrane protein involved in colicin uptake
MASPLRVPMAEEHAMDRFDERKHDHIDDVPSDRPADRREDEPAREGDVLGLGGTAVPKAPGDPTASRSPEAVARQRARRREDEAADRAARESDSEDSFGSTSVDMGAGGKGNTIK